MTETEFQEMIRRAGLPVKNSYNGYEAASILGYSKTTMYRLLDENAIPTFKKQFGGRRVTYLALKNAAEVK